MIYCNKILCLVYAVNVLKLLCADRTRSRLVAFLQPTSIQSAQLAKLQKAQNLFCGIKICTEYMGMQYKYILPAQQYKTFFYQMQFQLARDFQTLFISFTLYVLII